MKTIALLILAVALFTMNAGAEVIAPRSDIQTEIPVRRTLVPRNSVSVELLGRGLVYSFNYDRLISPKTALGIGFSTLSAAKSSPDTLGVSLTTIPLYANFYMNDSFRHRFLLTGGATLAFVSMSVPTYSYTSTSSGTTYAGSEFNASGTFVLPNAGLGYEFRGGSFLFRLSSYAFVGTGGILPWLGLSFGANF